MLLDWQVGLLRTHVGHKVSESLPYFRLLRGFARKCMPTCLSHPCSLPYYIYILHHFTLLLTPQNSTAHSTFVFTISRFCGHSWHLSLQRGTGRQRQDLLKTSHTCFGIFGGTQNLGIFISTMPTFNQEQSPSSAVFPCFSMFFQYYLIQPCRP